MANRKAKPRAVRPRTVNVYDHEVVAPDVCSVSAQPTERDLRVWWEHVKAYTEAMHGVGRAVLVKHLEDEGKFYLTSIRADLNA